MERSAPSWMVGLIIVFSIALAFTFGLFIYFHGQASALREQGLLAQRERQALDNVNQRLQRVLASMDEPLEVRRSMVEAIRAANNEEQVAIRELLLPQHSAAVGEVREATQQHQRRLTELLTEARRAQGDLQQEEGNALRAAIQADEDRRRLRDQVREQSQALERVRKENREQVLTMERDLAQRQARVDELLARADTTQVEFTSDGQVLRAHANSGFVIINRGHAHQLLKGTRFIVYNRRGGRNIVKGEVVVHEVEANIAICRVISEHDPNDPIIPGDHIYNRIFRPDEAKNFVVIGEFERFNSREISTIIREGGGIIDGALSTRTHYLVAGDGPDAARALEEASLLGVVVLSEDQAVEFMRQPLRFQVRRGMTFALAGTFDQVDEAVLRSFIRNSGGEIQGRIGTGLHVLIVGSNAADAIAEARQVGARVIDQGQLIHLMGSGR
ncbi:MAG: hypothetical protein EA402_06345 [Planctomycetota bacterium]|nr:MAG: hypothetical protein EA402_06345 [Planctomycetota bacterium]